MKSYGATATPAISLVTATAALTDLGILPVVVIAAVVGIATMLYKRFRR